MTLRAAPPRPAVPRSAPAYPRLLALGALLVAGCGGVIDKDGAKADPSPVAQKPDSGGETEPVSAGGAPFPYETGPEEDTAPPPPPPPPIDAAPNDAAPTETEPPSAGGEPFPFDDAGTPTPADDAGPAPSL
jgi:hypothetical protein